MEAEQTEKRGTETQAISAADVELRRIEARYALWSDNLPRAFAAMQVAMWGVPLLFVYLSVEALAGEETTLTVNFVFSVAVAVTGGGVGWLLTYLFKVKPQRGQLSRLRRRVQELERDLYKCQKGRGQKGGS